MTTWIDFQEVKQKVSLPDVLEVLGISEQFHQTGKTWIGCCPLPDHKHGPKPNDQQFKISSKDGIWQWYCFGDCKRGGSVIDFVQAMTGYSLAHTRLWFAEHFGNQLAGQKPTPKTEPKPASTKKKTRDETGWTSESPRAVQDANVLSDSKSPVKQLRPLRFRLQLDPLIPYLRERGLAENTITYFGCGLAQKGVLKGYVCWPIFRWPKEDPSENPLGYIGRWPGDDFDESADRPRYKIPQGFPVSHCVHGLAEAMDSTPDTTPLVVVEGVFKTAWLWQNGIPGAVSTLTSNVSDEQARLLTQSRRPIILCFDGTPDGYSAMLVAATKLHQSAFVRIVKLDSGIEPDDLTPEQIRDVFSFLF